jgi:hypothetical protein
MSYRIRDVDRGSAKLQAALADLAEGVPVTVGIHEDAASQPHRGPSDATVGEVAAIHEFRSGESWLRATVDESRPQIEKALSAAAQRAIKSAIYGRGSGNEVPRHFGRVALRFAKKAAARIRKLGLVDTKHLIESVEGRVRGEHVAEEA